MVYPDLTALFLSADYRLPYLEADDSKSFLHLFAEKMKRFIDDLKDLDELAYKTADKDIFINDVEALVSDLKEILKVYLDGQPAEAYAKFKAMAEGDPLFQDLNYSRLLRMEGDTPFFRSKKGHGIKFDLPGTANGYTAVKPTEMFHVPFEKRRSIGTNRYSIPGFPCIYLSDHLQTSWSECMSSHDQPFFAICYRNHRPLYLIDLVPLNVIMEQNGGHVPDGLFSSMTPDQALLNYVLVYPMICACHSKIEYIEAYDGEVKFKSEYIIPQLLMQWYRERKLLVDGIRYLSCTAESKFKGATFDKHNFVIPVDECLENGLCPTLQINFSASPVYLYQTNTGKTTEVLLNDIQSSLLATPVTPL